MPFRLAGHVVIEDRAVIGGCLGIHQFVHIGGLAMVGGMTRVIRDIPPYSMVEGHPGRLRGSESGWFAAQWTRWIGMKVVNSSNSRKFGICSIAQTVVMAEALEQARSHGAFPRSRPFVQFP